MAHNLSSFWDELVACRDDLGRLLDVIVRRATDVVGDAAVLTTVSEDGTQLIPAAVHHPDAAISEFVWSVVRAAPYRLGEGLAGRAALRREPVMGSNIDTGALDDMSSTRRVPLPRAVRDLRRAGRADDRIRRGRRDARRRSHRHRPAVRRRGRHRRGELGRAGSIGGRRCHRSLAPNRTLRVRGDLPTRHGRRPAHGPGGSDSGGQSGRMRDPPTLRVGHLRSRQGWIARRGRSGNEGRDLETGSRRQGSGRAANATRRWPVLHRRRLIDDLRDHRRRAADSGHLPGRDEPRRRAETARDPARVPRLAPRRHDGHQPGLRRRDRPRVRPSLRREGHRLAARRCGPGCR